jgi:hypothetical protein
MPFLHEDRDFEDLLRIVAEKRGLDPGLVEKDYWVTHTLWALQARGFDFWFKGGTSLSKAFGLIERFSEDLDLRIDPGTVPGAPTVSNWKSGGTARIRERREYWSFLERALEVPAATVERILDGADEQARSADFKVVYPGRFLAGLGPPFRPFVRLEVGRARVVPFVPMDMDSFIHAHCQEIGMLGAFVDNRPRGIPCVHPLVTLIDKIDAIPRHYERDPFEPARFVRHYEDAARIIRAEAGLPPAGRTARELLDEMLAEKDIRRRPETGGPAFALAGPDKRRLLEEAHAAIGKMYWGRRISLDDATATIRGWIEGNCGGASSG